MNKQAICFFLKFLSMFSVEIFFFKNLKEVALKVNMKAEYTNYVHFTAPSSEKNEEVC